MKIEHMGFLVPAPISMGKWYCDHLGFRLLFSSGDDAAGAVFVKDDASGTILEFCKPEGKAVHDYRTLDPLQVHMAIESDDLPALAEKLAAAGAAVVEKKPPTGGPNSIEIIMVRDPWGFSVQLINRAKKLE